MEREIEQLDKSTGKDQNDLLLAYLYQEDMRSESAGQEPPEKPKQTNTDQTAIKIEKADQKIAASWERLSKQSRYADVAEYVEAVSESIELRKSQINTDDLVAEKEAAQDLFPGSQLAQDLYLIELASPIPLSNELSRVSFISKLTGALPDSFELKAESDNAFALELLRQKGKDLPVSDQNKLNSIISHNLETVFSTPGKDGQTELYKDEKDYLDIADKLVLTVADTKKLHQRYIDAREADMEFSINLWSKDEKPGAQGILISKIFAENEHSPALIRLSKDLEKQWTSEQQKSTNEESISPLLVGKTLQQISGQLADLSWPEDTKDAPLLYGQWLQAQKDGANDPKSMIKADELREKLDIINVKRQEFLSRNLSQIIEAAGLNLPTFKLNIVPNIVQSARELEAAATYTPTNGEIEILESKVSSDDTNLNPKLISLVLHELAHHEQNILRMRDDFDAFESNPPHLAKDRVKQLYQLVKRDVDKDFLDNVLEWRDKVLNNKQLSEGEKKRAAALTKSMAEREKIFALNEKLDQLTRYLSPLNANQSLNALLEVRDNDERRAKLAKILDRKPKEVEQDYRALDEEEKNGSPKALRNKLLEDFRLKKQLLTIDLQKLIHFDSAEEIGAYTVGNRAYFFAKLHERRSH